MEIKVLASSSRGNAYMVTDGETELLLEAGIRIGDIRKGLGFAISTLAGCLVSHEHADHAQAAAAVMKCGVDVYTSAGTIEALGLTGHRLQPVQAHQQFTIGTWTVLPFEAVHDAQEPLGFLLAGRGCKLLYLTDSAYCKYRFERLTHLLIEANYSSAILSRNVADGLVPLALKNRILWNHFSLERLLEFLKANDLTNLQATWLLHLSDTNSDEALFKRRVQEATARPVYVAEA